MSPVKLQVLCRLSQKMAFSRQKLAKQYLFRQCSHMSHPEFFHLFAARKLLEKIRACFKIRNDSYLNTLFLFHPLGHIFGKQTRLGAFGFFDLSFFIDRRLQTFGHFTT